MTETAATERPMSAFETELLSLVRANYSILYVATHEEQRALASVRACAAETESYVWTWSVAQGLTEENDKQIGERSLDPVALLQHVMNAPPGGIIVLHDFHHFLRVGQGGQPSPQQVVGLRVLRDIGQVGAPVLTRRYGVNNYWFYEINECLSAGLRFEWFNAEEGPRAGRSDLYGLTFGLNYKPHPNFRIRPEIRWDKDDDAFTVDPHSNDRVGFGMDMILTF